MTIDRLRQGITNRTMKFINERRGWKTDRKIVVIESDDWGSIRTPSLNSLDTLLRKGINFALELGYERNDSLASNDDLEALGDVLLSVKDKHGNPAKMTLNYLMANPDFKKIKKSNFTEYHYELFTETLKRYPNHDRSFDLVKEGIRNKIFQPQFHGREHLNVQMWLNALQNDVSGVRESFDYAIFSNHIQSTVDDKRTKFREAYNILHKNEYDFVKESIKDGLSIFKKTFGFESETMIAPNYLWDSEVEDLAFKFGIKGFQGCFYQNFSEYNKEYLNKNGQYNYLGKKNQNDQVYLIRNAYFEPTQNSKLGYERCLRDINRAFNLKKPAIISSHRLNFIGGLNVKNRTNNLIQLSFLLKEVVRRYSDVEFLSSDEIMQEIIETA